MSARRLTLLAVTVLSLTLAQVSVARAAAGGGLTVGFVSTAHAHQPDSSATRVEERARFDPRVEQALDERPGSTVRASYRAGDDTWLAVVRAPAGGHDLARLVIEDGTLSVRSRSYLPADQYPPATSRSKAISIARHDARTQRAARRWGGLSRLSSSAELHDGTWEVSFWQHGHIRVRTDVSDAFSSVMGVYTGYQIAWKMARGDRRAFGDDANDWYVFWPAFALFALVMLPLEWRGLRSWHTMDVLALLSFGVSHEAFNRGNIHWSVPLAVPPLAYLFVRATWMFARTRPQRPASRRRVRSLPTWLLILLAVFCAGARYGLDAYGSNVVDVGYAGVAGARDIVHGRSPYGHMPKDNENGDTYGPLNYAIYVPAVLVWPHAEDNVWGQGLPAAHAVSIVADVACLVALVVIGLRFISRRGAVLLAAGWMTYPYTGWTLCNNVNDLVVAALLLFALAALPRAWLRGSLVGAAAMVKFVPIVALAPITHATLGRGSRSRQSLVTVGAAAVVVAASLGAAASAHHGWHRFVHATFGFQFNRDSPFSVWGLYHWRTAQRVAQALLLVGAAAAVVWPRERSLRQVAAGMAAAMLGVQLVLQHWFYLYIPWFFAPLLVAMVAAREVVDSRP